jgi:hypothetical protein
MEARRRRAPTRLRRRVLTPIVALAAIAAGGGSYLVAASSPPASGALTVAQTHAPGSPATVLTGTPAAQAAAVAHQLFSAASVVIVASASNPLSLASAARDASRLAAPMLLLSPPPPAAVRTTTAGDPEAAPTGSPAVLVSAAVRSEVRALHPSVVLAVGVTVRVLAAQLPGVDVFSSLSALPGTSAPAPLRHVALLVRTGHRSAATIAAVATAQAAGVQVIAVRRADPRADPAAIATLAATKPTQVLALGTGFGTAGELEARVSVAETGVQLPGGGQVLFPMHRLVALYGRPGTPALGALGEQNLGASIARIRGLAALYRSLSSVPVVPAFEILATVAQGSAGPNGLYSYESSVASLRPWVHAAAKAGIYVILDLQPGRANLLAQAKLYTSLLRRPDVGLALDPEWKLQPGQLPLRQIGSVKISEVNSVIRWLAALTARYRLPQKLLVLHQFKLSMLNGESHLDTHHSDLAIVIHMDGQGAPSTKQQTWQAIIGAAPRRVFFGWKNFFVKDHPMMDPRETMARRPQPVMISYQ